VGEVGRASLLFWMIHQWRVVVNVWRVLSRPKAKGLFRGLRGIAGLGLFEFFNKPGGELGFGDQSGGVVLPVGCEPDW